MTQQYIDFGTFPDDPDADAIRTAFQKVQNNFNELYATTTSGAVTSVNGGTGISVNTPSGNVVVSANIACVQVATSSLSIGIGGNGLTTAILSNTSQTLYIDINPSNVFSANFAANSSGGLANITGTLTVAASSQPNLTTAANLTTIGTLGNLTVTGTFNAGNLISANYLTGVLTSSSQPNITTIGNLGNLVVTGNSNLGNVATANFFSGDGGLLSNIQVTSGTAIINGTSNVTVGSSSNVNISVAGNTNVITVTSTGANVTGYLTSSGNITATNASLGNAVTANFFIGSGANLTNIAGGNVSGTVANATYAVTAGTANSVSGSNVSGAVSYATTANSVAGSNVSGAVSLATSATSANSVAGANVSGEVANATYATSAGSATSATTAGTVTTNAQPNITSVGTLSSLAVTGNITSGNVNATGNISATNFIGNLVGNISGNIVVPGSNTEVLFNNNGSAGTSNAFTFNQSSNVMTLNGNIIAGNIFANSGTINATTVTGTLTTNAQPNITSVGTLTGLTVSGVTNLGSNSNVIITGGNANAFLMTNGSGNLSWIAGTVSPVPGNTTEVIFNDAGNFSANSSLTFNKTTSTLSVANITGNLTTSTQSNITEVGTLKYLIVNTTGGGTGNISAVNVIGNHYGAATGLTSIPGANVTGTVANATYATSAGTATSATTAATVTTNAQPNITSIGTLANLTVGNAITSNSASVLSVFSRRTSISVTTNTIIDTFPVNSYRVAKYTIRASDTTGYQAIEVLLVHNGINSTITIYGSLSTTNNDIITIDTDVSAGNVNVYANAVGSSTLVNLLGTYVPD
jgi:hypothetical protein